MAPFMMSFYPSTPEKPLATPYKPVLGGVNYDIHAELYIPVDQKIGSGINVIDTIIIFVALLRLKVSPSIKIPIISNTPFSKAKEASDDEVKFIPLEIESRQYALEHNEGRKVNRERFNWIEQHWRTAFKLLKSSKELLLSLQSLDQIQFSKNHSLSLISLWGALEALFSPSRAELRFRISSLIAAYMFEPGQMRLDIQKSIAKLYDARSKAVHGDPSNDTENLFETFTLLANVFFRIIEEGKVPTKDDLEKCLFCVE